MNIQFMTEDNLIKDEYGKDVYKPNWELLMKNASCEEEKEMLNKCKERKYNYFTFSIVYTIKTNLLKQNIKTNKIELETGWTIYQCPWLSGKSKDEMYEHILYSHQKEFAEEIKEYDDMILENKRTLESNRVIPLYSINDNEQNKDLMKIIKLWKSCVDIFGVNGSCIRGDGFSFIYNHHKYFFSTNFNQSDITEETINILTKALEKIGAVDIYYNYGDID